MKLSLQQAWQVATELNDAAYQKSWPSWVAAQDMRVKEVAEGMKKDAYHEQTEYFREGYMALDDETKTAVVHWLQDVEFAQQFSVWFGTKEFGQTFQIDSIA